jgi:hypothetical protein
MEEGEPKIEEMPLQKSISKMQLSKQEKARRAGRKKKHARQASTNV